VTDAEYQRAIDVWNSFNCQTIEDYQNIYVRSDVALLACVMENTRNMLYNKYSLDLSHYVSLPMVASDACLKYTNQKLDLITDPTMHLWVEEMIRGGFCGTGSIRATQANNKYMSNYDSSRPSTYISYVDATNLYGWAMSQPLPTTNINWIPEDQIIRLRTAPSRFINAIPAENEVGYIFEVDLRIPEHLHDKFNDYPPCPVTRKVDEGDLAYYQQELKDKLGSDVGAEKLILDLHDKKNYRVHYKLLQLYLELGVEITHVHAGIQFQQSKWMKSYIDRNTEMRNLSTSDFQKDFWKLLNNAIYGKQLENKRGRENIIMVFDETSALNLIRKPTIKEIIPIDEDLSLYKMKRKSVKLDSPKIVGACILDYAKLLMYEIYYKFYKAKYGENVKLVYTDTDSLILEIQTDDLYQDMADNPYWFDLSTYEGKFHSTANAKVIGKFKDEYANKVISQVIAVRPKMYWVGLDSGEELKKAKGISRLAVKNQVTKEDFVDAIELDVSSTVSMIGFRSRRHQIFTEHMVKTGINAFCCKRFRMDAISSLAYGHKDINNYV